MLLMEPGYKSPARPIPIDLICDHSLPNSSIEMVHQMWLTSDTSECLPPFIDGDYVEDCDKDSWWFEAIQVADNIENKKSTSLELDCVVSPFYSDLIFWVFLVSCPF